MRAKEEVLRRFITRKVRKWKDLLGLASWNVKVSWDEREHLASNITLPEYRSAVLGFNLPRIQAEVDDWTEMEEVCVHELVHCLLWGLARGLRRNTGEPLADYLEEDTTTAVTTAILRAHGFWDKAGKTR